jgi:hypothetical protein
MTLEETNLTEEQLMSVRDRSLEEAYEPHDVGQNLLESRLEAHGFTVIHHGDDARHADDVFFGDGPDIALYTCPENEVEEEDPVAMVEVKTKEEPEWFGRLNKRHFKEYVSKASEVEVPVFLWFALVDTDEEAVLRDAFLEVEDTSQIHSEVTDIAASEVVFHTDDVKQVADSLRVVEGGDVIGVRNNKVLVDGIPNVHGNDVVELNDDAFRSFPWFLHRVDC